MLEINGERELKTTPLCSRGHYGITSHTAERFASGGEVRPRCIGIDQMGKMGARVLDSLYLSFVTYATRSLSLGRRFARDALVRLRSHGSTQVKQTSR